MSVGRSQATPRSYNKHRPTANLSTMDHGSSCWQVLFLLVQSRSIPLGWKFYSPSLWKKQWATPISTPRPKALHQPGFWGWPFTSQLDPNHWWRMYPYVSSMYPHCMLYSPVSPHDVPFWINSDINMLEHVGTTYFLAKYFFIVLFTHVYTGYTPITNV